MRVSIVVPSFRPGRTIERCLRSLRSQHTDVEHEIVVVDSSGDGTAGRLRKAFPSVRLLTSRERLWPGEARNRGVRAASGSVLAFVDADCFVGSGWLDRLDAAHRRHEAPVLGSCIENGNPESRVGTAYYYSAFSEWLPESPGNEFDRLECRRVDDLPGNCMSVKRWAFREFGPFRETGYCSDSIFNWRVRSAGHELLLVRGLKVWHVNPTGLGRLLGHRVRHGSTLALRRAEERDWSPTRKVIYALGSPLLLPTIFARTARLALAVESRRRAFLRAAPLILVSVASWSIGEGLGYLRSLFTPSATPGADG